MINKLFTWVLLLTYMMLFPQNKDVLEGRWDLEMEFQGKSMPAWLEITKSGHETLVGRFVFAFGSARPIAEIETYENRFTFSIPRQWEPEGHAMTFHGEQNNGLLNGNLIYTDGSIIQWKGRPANYIPFVNNPKMGKSVNLFNQRDLKGWHTDEGTNQWRVIDGVLTNSKSGANLISDRTFTNFKLEAEFRFPQGSNSGIYLRGRYEVQIADHHGLAPSNINFGAVYGFLEPNANAARPAGEWQSYNITLNGNRVSIVANGQTIITDQVIPGITGGALDSYEGKPGPIMIQGDHGPIEFRKVVITPLE